MRQLALLVLLMLAGCGTFQAKPVSRLSVEAHQQQLQSLQQWQIDGRIGFRSDDEAVSAALRWVQVDDEFHASLTGAFGQQSIRISQTPGLATLTGQGVAIAGRSAESLVARQYGVQIPLGQFRDWLRGLPGDAQAPRYDELGRLIRFDYIGHDGTRWEAVVNRFQQVEQWDLPASIRINSRNYHISLALRDWQTSLDVSDLAEVRMPPADIAPDTPAPVRLGIPGVSN